MHAHLHEKQSEIHLLNRIGQSQFWHQILFSIAQVYGNDRAGMFKLKWELGTLLSVQFSDSRVSQGYGHNAWSKVSSIGRMTVACFGPAQRGHSYHQKIFHSISVENGTLIWSLLTHWAPFLGFGRHPSSPVVLLRHTTAYGDAGEVDMVLWYKHKPCGQDSVSLRTLIPIPVIHVWHRNLLTGIPGWHFCQHWLKQVRKERVVCCGEELELQDNSKWY